MNEKQKYSRDNDALERLIEASLETERRGSPDLRPAMLHAQRAGVSLALEKPAIRRVFSFANLASAAGLVLGIAALGVALFVKDAPKVEKSNSPEAQAPESELLPDGATPDFPFIGYADTTKDEESYAEVRNHAELQALLEEGQTPERLALIG
ncbi:MAG: hypothetical protein KDB07_02950, partial [Planctomycetes bacterium]|nr:hypothetical protein [Planctomycetota bacterium]